MHILLSEFKKEMEKIADKDTAIKEKKYMQNRFEFFGVQSPARRKAQKSVVSQVGYPAYSELDSFVKEAWGYPQREFQYFAQELAERYHKNYKEEIVELFEYMIVNKSWWDTVDIISAKLVGKLFLKYPNLVDRYASQWASSSNMWLQRTAVLFQLKYKEKTDTSVLQDIILVVTSSDNADEFFIRKAVGWILREYSRINPNWVRSFVLKNDTKLSTLSKKEALRKIKMGD